MSTKKSAQDPELKKKTLEAWARILYKEGMIDLHRCNRMIAAVNGLRS